MRYIRYISSMNKEPLLSVQNLRKIYPGTPPHTAVDGISFDLAPGEILGFLGPNGAGKTTTIQILIGTLTYTGGSISYFGMDFAKERAKILQNVAFASTYISLPWLLTVSQNLHVIGRLYGLSGREIRQRAGPLLERFGIEAYRNRTISTLSSGQITRLMIIKAFLVRPQIVLLDEPTASLDPDVAQDVCAFLREEREKRGTSMLFTSHKIDEVAALCDRVVFLHKGKIVANDRPEILARSVSGYRLRLQIGEGLEQAATLATEQRISHQMGYRMLELSLEESAIPPFLSALSRMGILYTSIQIQEPSLEDYFVKMAKLK